MSIALVLILALIQGVAALLPVSGTGHLAVLQNLFAAPQEGESFLLLNVMLHLGSLAAVIVALKNDIGSILREAAEYFRGESREGVPPLVRLAMLIGAATLPLFAALPFYRRFAAIFRGTGIVGFMFLLGAVIMYLADKLLKNGTKKTRAITLVDALIIGVAQFAALIPGLSRLGVTVSVARARGVEKSFAVKFSMLMSIPALAGATLVSLYDAVLYEIDWSLLPVYLLGLAVSAAVALVAVRITFMMARRGNFVLFSYYCFGAGIISLLISLFI